MCRVCVQEGGLLIGAAVTQEEVIDKLLELSSPDIGAASKLAAGGKPEVTGSFMSFSNSFSRLWGGASSGAGAISADPQHVWLPLAKHLQRIAGNQASTIIQRCIILACLQEISMPSGFSWCDLQQALQVLPGARMS